MKNSALAKIQQELKAPKNQFNKFGNYSYRNCEDILEALKPLLEATGVIIHITDSVVFFGNRYYIQATVSLKDSDGNVVDSTTAYAREPETKKGMDESQITGASSSYARKYALNGLLAIDDVKDADSINKHDKTTESDSKPDDNKGEISSKQWNYMKKIGKDKSLSEEEVVKLVRWCAEQNEISPRDWRIAKLMLPEENFQKVLAAYLDALHTNEGVQQ